MKPVLTPPLTRMRDKALERISAEIQDGLRHGHFEFAVTCEIIGQERRRLVLKAGKTYQFLIPKEECLGAARRAVDFLEGSDSK